MPTVENEWESIRDKLRGATANLHAEFDAIGNALLAEGAEGYARFLAGQGAVVIPLEKRLEIAGIGNLLPDWAERARRFELKADLREIRQACEFAEVPVYRAPAELLGAAYVLEGSRLDASLLLQTLGRSAATRFLRHGKGKGYWPRFLSVLETSDAVRENFEQTMAVATEIFGFFIRAMRSAACNPRLELRRKGIAAVQEAAICA